MRIRKRPSREAGTGSPFLEQVKDEQKRTMCNGLKTKQVGAAAVKQKQDDATRYGEAGSIRKRKMKQEQGLMALASWAAVMSKREEEYKNKKKQECPIGCVSEQRRQAEEEIIGEQPRTPPPFAGEKPAEHGKKACSCGKKWGLRQEDMDPSLLSNKRPRTWNKNKNNHRQDTAEPMARPSHENCGLEHSDEEEEAEDEPSGVGGLRRARHGDQEELRKDMGPLLKAVHAVIGEAGMQGLTAREAGDIIRSRRLISDGDVPRTVKIAKAMRDSPYLVELAGNRGDCNARFVMWSTYLQTTSGKAGTTRAGVSVKPALVASTTASDVAGGSQVGRRGRRSQPQQRRRRGHGQYYTSPQQQHQDQTKPSSMVADDLVARVLMQVQKTLKAQTYQAPARVHPAQQAAQAMVDNKDNKTSHRHGIEHQEQRQCGQPQRQQQQRVFLIDINSLPPPTSMEINVTIEKTKQHILEANCKPQVSRPPLLIDLNLAPEDSC